MKHCTGCGLEKPLTDFHRNRQSPDGYQWRCKPCTSEYQFEYRLRKRNPARRRSRATNQMIEHWTENEEYLDSHARWEAAKILQQEREFARLNRLDAEAVTGGLDW